MSTKTLLMTAVLGAASIAAVMAADPVYSVNIVGYVNVTVPKGWSLISNPLKSGDNLLQTIIPTAPDGTSIYKFTNGAYETPASFTVFEGVGAWDTDTMALPPGEGAFILNSSASDITLTFVGEVETGALSNPIPTGWSIRASQVPQELDLTTLGFPAGDGDSIYFFNGATQSYLTPATFTVFEGISAWDTDPAPTPKVGEGFFVLKGVAANWTRTFNVQ
jgi:hypothetical protein